VSAAALRFANRLHPKQVAREIVALAFYRLRGWI
jgi:hypothetical protein